MLCSLIEHIEFPQNEGADECQRLFHGRGHAYDGLEYVNIDWLPPVILITVYKEVDTQALQDLATSLQENIPG